MEKDVETAGAPQGAARDSVMPDTLEEHRDYLHKIVKLQLFFLHKWLAEHPEEDFRYVLRERVDIYRKTEANPGPLNPSELFFDAPAWREMEDAALEVYTKCKDDRTAFEREAFEIFRASIDARCPRNYTDRTTFRRYQCGSLRYETALQEDGKTVSFHIANAVAPHSIFEDPAYLPRCFIDLMDKVEAELGATEISTWTWLNGNLKWLRLFPREWTSVNLSAPSRDVRWHYGFWGQFISARRTFNDKYGEILRTTGELPFYPRGSRCTIASMRRHLQSLGF